MHPSQCGESEEGRKLIAPKLTYVNLKPSYRADI